MSNNCIRIAAQDTGREEPTSEETELLRTEEGIRIASRCMVYSDPPRMKEQSFVIVPWSRAALVLAAFTELAKEGKTNEDAR